MSIDWANVLMDVGIDVPIQKTQFNIVCPFHDDTHASCSINTDKGKWICFRGCGQGRLQVFIQKILGLDKEGIEKYLIDHTMFYDLGMFDAVAPPIEGQLLEVEFPHISGRVPSWIFDRDFTKTTLKRWDCGTDNYNNLIIPINDRDSRLVGWVTRKDFGTPKYLYSKGLKKSKILFGQHLLKEKTPFVCITEGTLDTMWLDQNGFASVAILGASLSKSQEELFSSLHTEELVLCLDNDKAGQIGLNKAMACLSRNFVVSYIKIPKEYKDVQDVRNIDELSTVINDRTFF